MAVAFTALTVIAPVMTPLDAVLSSAHPVPPRVTTLDIPPAPVGSAASTGLRAAGALVHGLPAGTDLVAVTYRAPAPAGLRVLARVRTHGAWGAWRTLSSLDQAPDPASLEAARAATGTEALFVGNADMVAFRVESTRGTRPTELHATLVDGGDSSADAHLAERPPASAGAAVAAPSIITRAEWGADESKRNCAPAYSAPVAGAVVHHTVNSNTYSAADVPAMIRSMYAYHLSLGWCDIGYNAIVDRFGRIFEGRYGGMSRNVIGAHTMGFNSQTFGVASLGDHTAAAPSSATTSAISTIVAWKAWLNGFDPRTSHTYTSAGNPKYPSGTQVRIPRLAGHRDFYATECPGDLMYSRLGDIRTAAGAVYALGTPTAGSQQRETFARPAGSTISFTGRGYGHGRGMSQWGAYGAATKGLAWRQILAFYYPGTTITTSGNPTLRVRLGDLGTRGTTAVYSSGLQATDGTTTLTLAGKTSSGATIDRWRVVRDGTGLTLQYHSSGTWTSSSWRQKAGPLTLQHTSGRLRVVLPSGALRDYRGKVRTHAVGSGALAVNLVVMDSYLLSVVPAEMPASWAPAALAAQSVASRSYALYQRAHPATLFDTCDSTACQVYRGVADYTSAGVLTRSREDSRSAGAVTATTGAAITYAGQPALTEFSSSNGGITVGGPPAYQVVKIDPYDGVVSGSPNRWSASLSIGSIQAAYPSVGTMLALQIGSRSGRGEWGGRAGQVTVLGTRGSSTVSGEAFRLRVGLRSNWWVMSSAPAASADSFPKDLTADARPDLLAVDPDGNLKVLRSGPSGYTTLQGSAGWSSQGLVTNAGAWDTDNRGDVIARTPEGVLYYQHGLGTGAVTGPRYQIGTGWLGIDRLIAPGDFDGDGHSDLIARRPSDGALFLYRGSGSGKIIATRAIGSGWNVHRTITAVGDVTGDRIPDLLAIRASDNQLFLYPGNGRGGFTTIRTVGGSWAGYSQLIGVGDLSSDGRADIVGRRASDGALVLFRGNGAGGFGSGSLLGLSWAKWNRWVP